MSVRKRAWKTSRGETKEAWLIDYTDQHGDRHIETFAKKKDADKRHAVVTVDVGKGTHTATAKSITVSQAAQDWLRYVEGEEREPATLLNYRIHVKLHIVPRIGHEKLAKLTTPRVHKFRDDLLASLSRSHARFVLKSFKAILKDAHRRGNVAQNVARDVQIDTAARGKRKLQAGIDIPTPDEVRQIIHHATAGRQRTLMLTAVFTGLRGSELRGLAMAGPRPEERRTACSPARRPLQRHGQTEIGIQRPHDSARFRSVRLSSTRSRNGNWPARRGRMVWFSLTDAAIPKAMPTS